MFSLTHITAVKRPINATVDVRIFGHGGDMVGKAEPQRPMVGYRCRTTDGTEDMMEAFSAWPSRAWASARLQCLLTGRRSRVGQQAERARYHNRHDLLQPSSPSARLARNVRHGRC